MGTVLERCWIILADDGRHVSIGRATDPTEDEILAAEEALVAQGLGGWLAVMEGDYYRRRSSINLLEVSQLGQPRVDWDEAGKMFQEAREVSLHPKTR